MHDGGIPTLGSQPQHFVATSSHIRLGCRQSQQLKSCGHVTMFAGIDQRVATPVRRLLVCVARLSVTQPLEALLVLSCQRLHLGPLRELHLGQTVTFFRQLLLQPHLFQLGQQILLSVHASALVRRARVHVLLSRGQGVSLTTCLSRSAALTRLGVVCVSGCTGTGCARTLWRDGARAGHRLPPLVVVVSVALDGARAVGQACVERHAFGP